MMNSERCLFGSDKDVERGGEVKPMILLVIRSLKTELCEHTALAWLVGNLLPWLCSPVVERMQCGAVGNFGVRVSSRAEEIALRRRRIG